MELQQRAMSTPGNLVGEWKRVRAQGGQQAAPPPTAPLAEPEFTAALAELALVVGTMPRLEPELPGAVWRLPLARAEAILKAHQESLLARGCCLALRAPSRVDAELVALPSPDPWAAVIAFGTEIPAWGWKGREIANELSALAREEPFLITAVGRRFLTGRLLAAPRDPRRFARKLFELCPDLAERGAGSLVDLVMELASRHVFHLGWSR